MRSEQMGVVSTLIARFGDVVERTNLGISGMASDSVGTSNSNFRSSASASPDGFESFVAGNGLHGAPTIFVSDAFRDRNIDFDVPALQSVFLRVNFMTIEVGAELSLGATFVGLTL